MRRRPWQYCVIACFLASLAAPLQALDWPKWRGPASNGISAETGWNGKALSGTPKILWKAKVGRGHSAVSVAGGFAYTMGENILTTGGKNSFEEVVYCLDTRTGKEVWRYAYPAQYRVWPGPGATPTVDGNSVYTLGRDGEVYCFNARNGRVMWKRSLLGEKLGVLPEWQFTPSPTVCGDLLIVNAGKSGVAFNRKTGRTAWTSAPVAGGLSTPFIWTQGGKTLVLINGATTLNAVEPTTGKVVWSYPWASYADPMVIGSRLFLFGASRGPGCVMLELASGKPVKVWESTAIGSGFVTGTLVGNNLYQVGTVGRDQCLACVDPATGSLRWKRPIGDWGSLSASDNKIIVLGGMGDLFIAEANPAKYTELSRTRIFPLKAFREYPREAPQCCWTAPVLANGRLYVRDTYGNIACVDVSR